MKRFKQDGWITIRPYKHHPDRLTGDKLADGNTLSAIIGKRGFPASDYDAVLTAVSEQGYGLEMLLES